MFADDLVVLDFETTGLSPTNGDRITEVAAVRLSGDRIVDRYQSLANCGVRIPPFITAYTGITQTMVDRAPPFRKVIKQLLQFIADTPVVAHNASFDEKFLDNECRLANYARSNAHFICSMRVARRIYPHFSSHALASLAERLNISYRGSAHRAAVDAEVTANLMKRIGKDIRSIHQDLSKRVVPAALRPRGCPGEDMQRSA